MFPCYRRWVPSGEVVEFTSPSEGTIITDTGNALGYHSKSFVSFDNAAWEPCEDPRLSRTNRMLKVLRCTK